MGILIFVDDVMSAGTADDIRRAIRNFAEMEIQKKFTYGLKKTNYMVIKTGREKDEEILEEVKLGQVKEVNEYEYIGFWINQQGNCSLQIEKKKGNVKGKISALKSLASYSNVGPCFVQVRLFLYEICIIPSILYNMEAWNPTKAEIKKLESIQHSALCSILHLPKSTPYIGLLNELGMWRMEERLIYRKTMLYHNIMNSNDDRLCKRMLQEQQQNNEIGCFFDITQRYFQKLDMDISDVPSMTKSLLKQEIKAQLNNLTIEVINKTLHMTKLRFITSPQQLKRREYIDNMAGSEALKTLKTRLNMQPVYGNYKGDLTKPRLCQYCEEEDDTTEHLVSCNVFGWKFEKEQLSNEKNTELWLQINQLVDFNLKNRM